MKKLCCFLILCMLVSTWLIPVRAEETPAFGFSMVDISRSYEEDSQGEGWYYTAETHTLTLCGIDASDDSQDNSFLSIRHAPKDFSISLADGTVNKLYALFTSACGFIPLRGSGRLEIVEIYGDITVDGATVQCSSTYASLRVNSGKVVMERIKAAQEVTVYGGEVFIDKLDVYRLHILGGNVHAKEFHNCNGASPADSSYSITGGSLTVDSETQGLIFLVFFDFDGKDLDKAIPELLSGLGNITDRDGAPVTVSIEPVDGSEEMRFVRFLRGDGSEATYLHCTPSVATPEPTKPSQEPTQSPAQEPTGPSQAPTQEPSASLPEESEQDTGASCIPIPVIFALCVAAVCIGCLCIYRRLRGKKS